MKLVKVGYCGKKDEQPDLIAGTGKVWGPGVTHLVTPAQAAILLEHTDSWVHEGEVEVEEPVAKPVTTAKKKEDEEPFANVNLANMTKTQLIQFAHRSFGVKLEDSDTKTVLTGKVQNLIKGARVTP